MLRLASLFVATASLLAAADRPNFIFLFADDQRADTIGAWGNPNVRTPNLDSLVREGYSFRNNYCMGGDGGAICVFSRAMLNSGKAYFRIPMDLDGELTLGQQLRAAGYHTYGTGRWHNQRPAWLRSFDQGRSIMFGGMSDHTNVPVEDLGPDGTLKPGNNERKFSSQLFADNVIDFLDNYKDDTPFYVYAAFTAPHDPRQAPFRYREFYYRARPPLPINFMPQHPFDNGDMATRDEMLAPWPRTAVVISDQLAEYYGLITHLDEQIGRILAALERTGKVKNTYIIYSADHGLALGSHGLVGKQNIYEDSMKSPLIVRGPDVPAGVDGIDIRPLWTGQKPKNRDTISLAYRNLMRSVRDERWKLIRYPQINYTQLFDLENDPNELHSLADDPAQKARVEKMMAMIEDAEKHYGDKQELTVANPKPKEIDMTGHERHPDPWQPMWLIEKYFPGWL
jgi:arylsulfatase A-like enzyme